jgi:hypothetical protein
MFITLNEVKTLFMKTEEELLTAQQSIDIITSMIRQAKGKAKQNSFYFLFWGWIVVVANLGMFILTKLEYSMPYIIWTITIPAWIYTMIRAFRQSRHEGAASTHFDRITGAVWISFGVVIFTMVLFGRSINFQLNPIILLMSAIPTFTSGMILKFRPLMYGGILFWFSSIISFSIPMEYQPLISAIALTGGYLVPGYILKSKKEA